jgi:hypothetical protein
MAQRYIVEEYQRHYFSGNQARVYFDNQYVGEVVYLEYNITTNTAPIYAYNSEQFRMVAKGNILVQGNFAINFTELGYLIKIANDIKVRRSLLQQESSSVVGTVFRGIDTDTAEGIMKFITSHDSATRGDIIKWYRDRFWTNVDPNIKQGSYPMHPWEFDRDSGGHVGKGGFSITVMFGVPNSRPNQFAVKTIQDVHVTGESMVVQPTGQGLLEQYPFFARVIDEDVTFFDPVQSVIDQVEANTAGTTSTAAPSATAGGNILTGGPVQVTLSNKYLQAPQLLVRSTSEVVDSIDIATGESSIIGVHIWLETKVDGWSFGTANVTVVYDSDTANEKQAAVSLESNSLYIRVGNNNWYERIPTGTKKVSVYIKSITLKYRGENRTFIPGKETVPISSTVSRIQFNAGVCYISV